MRGARRRHLWPVAAGLAVAVLAAALIWGVRWGDKALYPPRGADTPTIILVSNGFHSGLVISRSEVAAGAALQGLGALAAVAGRFARHDWIEFGWGEDRFYRAVPTPGEFDWLLGLRALFRPGNESVMHVSAVDGDPLRVFGGLDVVRIRLSPAGFAGLLRDLDGSFAHDRQGEPLELGPGLSGQSYFFRAVGHFSFASLCNHWTARLLDSAGVPVSPLLATLPRGLVWDLTVRSGLPLARDELPPAGETP